MFALATETLCCSKASCKASLSSLDILSNSSINNCPPFAKTIAPPSKAHPLKNSSLTTLAVSPTPETDFPATNLPFGAIFETEESIVLFAEL